MWKYFPLEVKRDKLHKIEHMYGYLKKQARFSRKSLAKTGKTIFTKCFFFAISLFEQQSWYTVCTEEGLLFCLLSGSALPHSLQKVLLLATT